MLKTGIICGSGTVQFAIISEGPSFTLYLPYYAIQGMAYSGRSLAVVTTFTLQNTFLIFTINVAFELCPLSGVPKTVQHNVPEIGSPSVLCWIH